MRLISLLLLFTLWLQAADEYKVIYDLTTSKAQTIETRLISGIVNNNEAFMQELQELKAVVIIHGDAYKFFIKNAQAKYPDDAELKNIENIHKRLASLTQTYDVVFLMCHVGAKKRDIKQTDLLEFVEFTPNATFGLIKYQNEGYAFVPMR